MNQPAYYTLVALHTMCIICEPILGPTIDHSEKECPLMASAYCGICVCYGHFQADCVYRVDSVCDSVSTIKSTVPKSHANILYIPDREVVHRAYLSSHGQVIYGKISKNKAACESIAKLIGYTSICWKPQIKKVEKTKAVKIVKVVKNTEPLPNVVAAPKPIKKIIKKSTA